MFQIRNKVPDKGNKYYNTKSNGGYSENIKGKCKSTGKPCVGLNVLANCTGYANGRFAEIIGKNKIEYQLICNAENFIEKAKKYGLKISNKPVAGGIMVWQKGSLKSGDGAGHVCIVEKVIDSNTIYTSESGYNSTTFWNATRKNNNGKWGQGAGYKYRGCIVNPSVEPEPVSKTVTYQSYDKVKKKWLPKVKSGTKEYAGNIGNAMSGLKITDLTYRSYDMKKKKWLPYVTGTSDYAGNLPNDMGGVEIKGANFELHIKGGGWVSSQDGVCCPAKTIDAVRITKVN